MEKRRGGTVVTIFALLTVAVIVLVVLLRNFMNRKEGEAMDVSGFAERGITEAYMIPDENGALSAVDVYVTVPGYKDNIDTRVRIEKSGERLLDLQIIAQNETPELGGRITESEFLRQFKDKELPIALSGQTHTNARTADNLAENNTTIGNLGGAVQRMDGVYQAVKTEDNGYESKVTMVITNGEITEILWDSFDADGNGKRELSIKGEYTMTEDGPLWADQADALQSYVIEHQGLNGLSTNEQGRTDVVSGVSINIAPFKELVNDCLRQATGGNESSDNADNNTGDNTLGNDSPADSGKPIAVSEVDAVSGATITSQAVITAVQTAHEFVLGLGN